ncbi:hypothetical protein [Streptomyces sp. NPDC048282]|uniref:hypothetical protein n=1 Tax=Streptomyces sp. NPDC048282 TaxID=3365528 RepID=UPI00371FEC16
MEHFVAAATVVVGVFVLAVVVWYGRRVPYRRRIGYRVQMDTSFGDDARVGGANLRLGLFGEASGMSDATLVLLRIENDGLQGIDRDDYTGSGVHGLAAVFTGRFIRGVSVVQPDGTIGLLAHFSDARGFGYDGGTLRIPRVPLDHGDHFKLLVLLSGGGVGSPIRLMGGIREGTVRPSRSAAPDEKPLLFSRAAQLIAALLTLCIFALAAMVFGFDRWWVLSAAAAGAVAVLGAAGLVVGNLRAGPASPGKKRFSGDAYGNERARQRSEIGLLLAVALLGCAIAYFAASPLLREPRPLGFSPSETAQMIAAVAGLASAIAAGAAAVIKAVAYLTYARADMVRAKAALPPSETTEPAADPQAQVQSDAGE